MMSWLYRKTRLQPLRGKKKEKKQTKQATEQFRENTGVLLNPCRMAPSTTSAHVPFRIYYTWIWVIPTPNGGLSINSVERTIPKAFICAENTCVCEKQWFSPEYSNICCHKEIHQKLLSSLGQSSLL